MSFTPGPWSSKANQSGGRLLIREGCIQEFLQIVPSEDAHLIAAAPDLLEALEAMQEMVLTNGWGRDYVMLITAAAIAKARGES